MILTHSLLENFVPTNSTNLFKHLKNIKEDNKGKHIKFQIENDLEIEMYLHKETITGLGLTLPVEIPQWIIFTNNDEVQSRGLRPFDIQKIAEAENKMIREFFASNHDCFASVVRGGDTLRRGYELFFHPKFVLSESNEIIDAGSYVTDHLLKAVA